MNIDTNELGKLLANRDQKCAKRIIQDNQVGFILDMKVGKPDQKQNIQSHINIWRRNNRQKSNTHL